MKVSRLHRFVSLCFVPAVLVTACTQPLRAGIILPPGQTDFFVMMENAAEFGAFLGLTFVTDPPTTGTQTLSWTGSFDNTGWMLQYAGNYNGELVTYSMTGLYNTAGTVDSFMTL